LKFKCVAVVVVAVAGVVKLLCRHLQLCNMATKQAQQSLSSPSYSLYLSSFFPTNSNNFGVNFNFSFSFNFNFSFSFCLVLSTEVLMNLFVKNCFMKLTLFKWIRNEQHNNMSYTTWRYIVTIFLHYRSKLIFSFCIRFLNERIVLKRGK